MTGQPATDNGNVVGLHLLDTVRPSLGETMQGLVHIVDDDASFRKAMERRLKRAGYEVVTYASAQHLLDRLPDQGELAASSSTCGYPTDRSGAARASERTRFDAAHHIPHWLSRYSDHGAGHQGGCG